MVPRTDDDPPPGKSVPGNHLTASDAMDEPAGITASATTTATYDEIAHIYLERWLDRSAIHEHLRRFASMLRAYDLAGLPIVDIGCGPGFDAAYFREIGLRTIALDLSRDMMVAGRPEFGGDYIQADMRHLPLAGKIGGLWVNASFLHVDRAQAPATLRGFASALVPDGILYLSLKSGQGAEWISESHGVPLPRYFVYWQPDDVDDLLCGAGFRIVEGWLSAADEATRWLIRFARKADRRTDLNLTTI
ncbi:MAG TPA: class I SAM-dependent methyltransferase [Anaerolineae bacterium]|jgi:SAM-dependent methyltransferase|nr:class I SAM-dependent methyltransferase [Anaerolineae bacterium]